jgi:vacuolar protein sorting-associated protein IST1
MLDVYDEIEGYFNLLIERIHLIAQQRECPVELEEAASGILYAASRCGDFPEIQEIRTILTSRFGKEFAARAIELRNNCKVHPKIITKLSTRMPSLENRMKVLKEIASENNITLQLEQNEEQVTNGEKQNKHKPEIREEENVRISVNEGKGDEFSDSFKGKKKYKDVADAAQAAFESAAYAAAAARAAVELSRFQSYDDDDDHDDGHNSSSHQPRKVLNENDSVKAMSSLKREEFNKNTEELEKVNSSSSSDADEIVDEIKVNSGVVLESKMQSSAFIDLEKRPLSVRTRRVHGY